MSNLLAKSIARLVGAPTPIKMPILANIGILIGVGAPTSLAIDLANKFDMTLVGFVKEDSFNIYSNKDRIVINT